MDYTESTAIPAPGKGLQAGETGGGSAADSRDADATRIFRFENLDRICEAARAVGGLYSGVNTLFKKPGTRQYYLVMKRKGGGDLEFSRSCNILAEYAMKLSNEYASEAYFREHYEVMIADKALQDLQKI